MASYILIKKKKFMIMNLVDDVDVWSKKILLYSANNRIFDLVKDIAKNLVLRNSKTRSEMIESTIDLLERMLSNKPGSFIISINY